MNLKKSVMLALLPLFVLSVVAAASASADNIRIEQIGFGYSDVVEQGASLNARIRVTPYDVAALKDTRIRVYVPELNAYGAARPFEATRNSNELRTVTIPIYEDVASADYYARIVVYSDGEKRVVHRPFSVQ